MRLAVPVLLIAAVIAPAAEPTKAELTKKIDEHKQEVAKAKKVVDELKADKDIGKAVVKDQSLWAQITKGERQEKEYEAFLERGGRPTRTQHLQAIAVEEGIDEAHKARARLFDDPAVKKHEEKVKKYKEAHEVIYMGEHWIEKYQEALKKAKK